LDLSVMVLALFSVRWFPW